MTTTAPVVQAFIVCDYVIHEHGTNKKSCIGIFQQLQSREFPCRHGQLAIYANITDALGEYRFRIELVHLKTDRKIGAGETPPIRIPDRLQTAELAFQLQNLVFPEPGRYEFQLHANDEMISRKVISLLTVPASPPEG